MESAARELWQRIGDGLASTSPPDVGINGVVAIVLAAAVLSVPRRSWRVFGLFVTVVHELGHVSAALLTLQRVTGITLRFDHSGTTGTMGRRGWRAAFTTFWGYPVPAVVGAALVHCAAYGRASAALSVGALVLVASLTLIRNLQGILILGGTAAVSLALVWFGEAASAGYVCLALGIALLVGSCRDWVKVVRVHRRRRDVGSSDAYLLQRATGLPSALWLGMFALVIGAALVLSLGPLALLADLDGTG